MAHKVIDVPGYDPDLEAAMKDYNRARRPYSINEEETLRRYYGKVDKTILAKKLGRTAEAIQTKAGHMGLTRKL